MTKAEAQQRMTLLREEIVRNNRLYYDQDAPEISDAAYDTLTQELKALEKEYPELVTPDSPTQYVGGKPNAGVFGKVRHQNPLLSLRDVFSPDEVEDWYTEVAGAAPVSVEQKIDGLSMAVTYRNGKLVRAATRGDGHIGEDVTANAAYIDGIPAVLDLPEGVAEENELTVRCEVIMPVAAFEKVNAELEAAGKKLFANPRNAAAGSLRVKDPNITKARGLSAIAFQIMSCSGWDNESCVLHPMSSQVRDVDILRGLGFRPVPHTLCRDFYQANAAIHDIGLQRGELPYWIDGAVVKVDDISRQKEMGTTEKYPHWAVAYKYPPERKETIIRDIVTQTGRTGVITPVAVFDPVLLCGTSVNRATLHNQQFMDDILGGVAIGDTVTVHKSGEIIPEVLSVDHTKRPEGAVSFKITHCPVCGAEAVLDKDEDGKGSVYVCSNDDCPAKLEKHLVYWCSKHVMDIEGFGPSTVHSLMESGALNSVADIYDLTMDVLTAEPSVGPVRGKKLLAAIEKSKGNDIDRLIAGLGVSGVGRVIGKALAKRYASIWDIAALSEYELCQVDGVGEITAHDLYRFFQNEDNPTLLHTLEDKGVNTKSLSYMTGPAEGPLSGMVFVITGTLSQPRDAIAKLITDNGGTVSGSVSKKTSVLVAGEAAGSKLQKAKDLDVQIWNEADLRERLKEE